VLVGAGVLVAFEPPPQAARMALPAPAAVIPSSRRRVYRVADSFRVIASADIC